MSNPPTGTVTFLFTDIEGSTQHWEHQPQAMRAALARHDAILRDAIQLYGGHIFKTVGDAFYAAFSMAHNALSAGLHAQRALQAEDWGELGTLKVRMALHTGAAEERDGDYFGQPLNRVARLLSGGHGGQILLSVTAQELTRDNLPVGVDLKDLGEHRLKDLIRSERVFQVTATSLPSEFPQLKTLDSRPNNLPVQATPLIGREKELESVTTLLTREDLRLLTLTGPGGTGKTRLGLQAAAEALDDFTDGVFFVNLAPLRDPLLVASEIAQTLGVREAAGQPLVETLSDYLQEKQILLVLDNFEQVAEAAPMVARIIGAAAWVKLLVTSRVRLHVRGEHEYGVPPLALPDPKHLPPLERLTQYEAVRLFIERATALKPDFEVTNDNAPTVAEICARLDGLPLALELAAARIKILPPQAMLARLQSRLKILTGGDRDLPARQQTLRNAIEWSYDLLDNEEKKLFRRLAVFVGGRTLEAIEAVCNANSDLDIDVLDGVSSLVDESLLRQDEGVATKETGGEPRFVMLETVHEYAREKLEESGEVEALGREHALYFMRLVGEAEPHLTSENQVEWLARLEAEHDNLRAALAWSRTHAAADGGELALNLAGAMVWFWYFHGYLTEGRNQLDSILDFGRPGTRASGWADPSSNPAVAKALNAVGALAFLQSDYAAARSRLEESLQIWRALGDKRGTAFALMFLGRTVVRQGEDWGRSLGEESVSLFREVGEKWGLALALDFLGEVTRDQGDNRGAVALHDESLELYRTIGHKWGVALQLSNFGRMALSQGDYAAARAQLEEALVIEREVGDKWMIAWTLHNLGDTARQTGDQNRAIQIYNESLGLFRELGDKGGIAKSLNILGTLECSAGNFSVARSLEKEALIILKGSGDISIIASCLVGIGRVAAQTGQPQKGARLLGMVDTLLQAEDFVLTPVDRILIGESVTSASSQLSEEEFQKSWQEGRAMTLEQAIAYALDESENPSQESS